MLQLFTDCDRRVTADVAQILDKLLKKWRRHLRFDVNGGLRRDLLSDRILARSGSMKSADQQYPAISSGTENTSFFDFFYRLNVMLSGARDAA